MSLIGQSNYHWVYDEDLDFFKQEKSLLRRTIFRFLFYSISILDIESALFLEGFYRIKEEEKLK